MRKSRLAPQRTPFEREHFYVYADVDRGNYQFRDRTTHVAVSTSSSAEGLKECISKVLNRYKTYDNYNKVISSMSEPAVSKGVKDKREEELKVVGDSFNYIYEDVLNTFRGEVTPKVRKRVVAKDIVPAPLEEVETPPVCVPKRSLIKRTKKTSRL